MPYQQARTCMVTSGEKTATGIGVEILRNGGNAIDAAVAMGFALSVTHPGMCGLGVGRYALVRRADGRADFYDIRQEAPEAAADVLTLPAAQRRLETRLLSARNTGVPGTVKGFQVLHQDHGSKIW